MEAVELLKSENVDNVIQLNLIDYLYRNSYSMSLTEFNLILTKLTEFGGFKNQNEVIFNFRIFNKYLADAKYYNRDNYNTSAEKKEIAILLDILTTELFKFSTSAFIKEDVAMNSLIDNLTVFYKNFESNFEIPEKLIIANCVLKLFKIFDQEKYADTIKQAQVTVKSIS